MYKIAEISESCFRIYPVVDGKDGHFIATFISRELAEEYVDMKEDKEFYLAYGFSKDNIPD